MLRKIAIAVVLNGDRALIARRQKGSHLEGLWEFPGGHVEENETPKQAVVRECREECSIEVAVDVLLDEVIYEYPDRKLHLFFYQCQWLSGELNTDPQRALQWCPIKELHKFPLPPANQTIVHKLLQKFG